MLLTGVLSRVRVRANPNPDGNWGTSTGPMYFHGMEKDLILFIIIIMINYFGKIVLDILFLLITKSN